jgi:hypothetical protein
MYRRVEDKELASLTVFEPYRLSHWEECALRLREIAEDGGHLMAIGDKVRLSLPLELKDSLSKHLGIKISILRTDNAYLIRIQDEEK